MIRISTGEHPTPAIAWSAQFDQIMRRVAAGCLAIASGLYLAACVPNLPGLPSILPASPTAGTSENPTTPATTTLSSLPATGSTPVVAGNATATFTAIPSLTAPSNTAAGTPSTTPTAAGPTETATLVEAISLDKLPPGTVYKRVRIENQSRTQLDISLHCTTLKDLHTVLEYENVRNLTVQAPEGNYVYVVYVGGRRIIGSFSLLPVPGVTITVYRDRVVIH